MVRAQDETTAEIAHPVRSATRPILMRREMVAFLPAVALAGLWFGLAPMVLLGATALIVAWMTRPVVDRGATEASVAEVDLALPAREATLGMIATVVAEAQGGAGSTACLVIGLDDPRALVQQTSRDEYEEAMRRTADRLHGALRDNDRIARLDATRFAVLLRPSLRLDLESLIQLSVRLQEACEAPISIGARSVSASFHVGFCLLGRAPAATAEALLIAAEEAAAEARRNGPGGIRAFSHEIRSQSETRDELAAEIATALEDGQIVAYFQPQLSTSTGKVTGVEAVPRWLHRTRGMLDEAAILPAIEAGHLRDRLVEVMLYHSFHALREWDRAGIELGPVSLTIAADLMLNPRLAEKLKWECDRFEIAPARLRLVLHQDILTRIDDEVVSRNIAACKTMGCALEMADFGSGPATISSIRRTGAERLRIDHSFLAHVDRDPGQQRVVAAIIAFAEGLGLETLAEGVPSLAVHAILGQLGCGHVQGRAISAPLSVDEVLPWFERHQAKLALTPRLGGRSA